MVQRFSKKNFRHWWFSTFGKLKVSREEFIETLRNNPPRKYILTNLKSGIAFQKMLEFWKKAFGINYDENFIWLEDRESEFEKISFGIEFEGNVRGEKGIIEHGVRSRYYCVEGWDFQTDPTVYFELRSPVWEDVNEAMEDIKKQFIGWVSINKAVPFFKPTRHFYSVGGHIHLGIGKNKIMSAQVAQKLIGRLVDYLPFLYFINANGVVGRYISARMVERPYSPLKYNTYVATGNREEWWYSDHKTIEFRRFDGNVPAVQLAIVWLMQQLAKKAVEKEVVDMVRFQMDCKAILKYPTDYKVLLEYREKFRILEDCEIANLPQGVKEVLILTFCFLKNPALFQGTFTYDFCLKAVTEGAFLEEKYSGDKKKIVSVIRQMVPRVKKMKDLLDLIILDKETEYLMKIQNCPIPPIAVRLEKNQEKVVEKYLTEFKKPPFIKVGCWENIQEELGGRIGKVWCRLRELNLNQLNQLSAMTGESAKEMFEDVGRYYVKIVNGEVVGYFVVNVRDKILVERRNVEISEIKEVLRANNIQIKLWRWSKNVWNRSGSC
ncbi:MAG: hypothetical protein QXG39_00325 [Candidatus Aenigmatarchaeota archaeon]